MSAYKFLENNNHISFIYPFQDLLVSLTEALKNQDYNAYIDLVSHLRSLSILAFDKRDIESLEKIDSTIIKLKKHVSICFKNKSGSEKLYRIETESYNYALEEELRVFIEYRFSSVIERVCISALRKTIFKEQIPEAQGTIFYEASRDIALNYNYVNGVLEENKISPCEAEI